MQEALRSGQPPLPRARGRAQPPEEASEIGFVRETDPQMKQFFDQVRVHLPHDA